CGASPGSRWRRWWRGGRRSGSIFSDTGSSGSSSPRCSPPRSSPRSRGRSASSGSREMASGHMHVVPREVPPELHMRLAVSAVVVLVAFGLVGVRLWYLQVDHGQEMGYLSEQNRIRVVSVPAARGVVYDRHGEILVDNRPSFDVVFVPEDARDRRRQVLRNLAGFLGDPEPAILKAVRMPTAKRA